MHSVRCSADLPGDLAAILGPQQGIIPGAPQAIAAGAPTDLLRRRPDIRQAELAAATQSAAVGVAEADLYPSFGLSGFLGVVAADGTNTTRTGNSGFGQLFNTNALAFVGGPYFSWNILNYGRIRNNVRVNDAQLQQLLENYQSTVLNAVREVEDGMVAFLRSREQERILVETEVSAQRSLAIANVGYREGFSDFQRVLDAQGTLLRVAAAAGRGAQHDRQQRDRDLSGAGRRLGNPVGPGIRGCSDPRHHAKARGLGRSSATGSDPAAAERPGKRMAVAGLVERVNPKVAHAMSEPQESVQVEPGTGPMPPKASRQVRRSTEAPVPPVKPGRHPRREGWIRCASGC